MNKNTNPWSLQFSSHPEREQTLAPKSSPPSIALIFTLDQLQHVLDGNVNTVHPVPVRLLPCSNTAMCHNSSGLLSQLATTTRITSACSSLYPIEQLIYRQSYAASNLCSISMMLTGAADFSQYSVQSPSLRSTVSKTVPASLVTEKSVDGCHSTGSKPLQESGRFRQASKSSKPGKNSPGHI